MNKAAQNTLAQSRAIGLDPHLLGLTIFPTEKCNFRCVYCYEEFPNRRLTDELTSSIVNLLTHRIPDLTTLSIGWFGGEPLLEWERVVEINELAKSLCASNYCTFRSHMTTNGYLLTLPVAQRLIEVGINSFQVSLDGIEADHNRTRRLGNNGGTYSTIFENLINMKSLRSKFEVVIRLHVHGGNTNSIRQLIDVLVDGFSGDPRFKMTLQKVLKYDSSHDMKLPLANKDGLQALTQYFEQVIPFENLIGSSGLLLCCYAAMPNHFVIRSNGRVQKCTVALYDDRNDVGQLLPDGTFRWFDTSRMIAWSSGLLSGDVEHMACPWKQLQFTDQLARAERVV